MKKYSLIGILGLVILVIGVVAWKITQNSSLEGLVGTTGTSSLLKFLPEGTDQLMLVTVTPGTKELLLKTNAEIDPATFGPVLETLKSVVIAQASAPETIYNAVLFEGTSQFSPDSIQALGLVYAETGYEAQEIAPNIRIYADDLSLAYFMDTQGTTLLDRPEMKELVQEMGVKQASVLFYSTPTEDTAGSSPLAAAFAQKLQYTAVIASPTIDSTQGSVVMQFSGTTFTSPEAAFTPTHDEEISEETLLYLEARKLLDTFGLSESQFTLAISLFMGQLAPGTASLLSNEELTQLYRSLNDRLTVFVELAATPFGMGLHLVLDNPESFDVLTALSPVRKTLLGGFIGTTGGLEEQRTETSRSLNMAMPNLFAAETGATEDLGLGAELSFPLLSVTQEADTTTLSLLAPKSDAAPTAPDLVYENDSLLTFRYNPGVAAQDGTVNPLLGDLGNQLATFGTGIIVGHLDVDSKKQQLIATFESR